MATASKLEISGDVFAKLGAAVGSVAGQRTAADSCPPVAVFRPQKTGVVLAVGPLFGVSAVFSTGVGGQALDTPFSVDAQKFSAVAQAAQGSDKVEIKVTKARAEIGTSDIKARLGAMYSDAPLPQWLKPTSGWRLSVNTASLRLAYSRCIFGVKASSENPSITAFCVDIGPDGATISATDNMRICRHSLISTKCSPREAKTRYSMLYMPSVIKTAADILQIFGVEDFVMDVCDHGLVLRARGLAICLTPVGGMPAPYDQVVAASSQELEGSPLLTCGVESLHKAMKQISCLCDDLCDDVALSAGPGSAALSGRDRRGQDFVVAVVGGRATMDFELRTVIRSLWDPVRTVKAGDCQVAAGQGARFFRMEFSEAREYTYIGAVTVGD